MGRWNILLRNALFSGKTICPITINLPIDTVQTNHRTMIVLATD